MNGVSNFDEEIFVKTDTSTVQDELEPFCEQSQF